MKTYEIEWYDFDRWNNEMCGGFMSSMDAETPEQALELFIQRFASYSEGTKGYEDYKSITEIDICNEPAFTRAFPNEDGSWEIITSDDEGESWYTYTL